MGRSWPLAAVVVLGLSPVYAQPQATAPPSRVPDPPFNTLTAAQDLEASGFTGDQAAGLAHALAYANSLLATQDDVDRLVNEVRTSNAELRARSAEQNQTSSVSGSPRKIQFFGLYFECEYGINLV